jgi:hypothetical protein
MIRKSGLDAVPLYPGFGTMQKNIIINLSEKITIKTILKWKR